MKTWSRPLLGLFLSSLMLSVMVGSAGAQSEEDIGSASDCRATVNAELAKEQRLYRSVLFGHLAAEQALPGEVRYDQGGNTWIKVAENKWKSVAKGFSETDWTDPQMDDQDEVEIRRGIFETRRVLTSELLPYLTQSFRALQCRSDVICETVRNSVGMTGKDPQEIELNVPGCIGGKRKTYASCHLAEQKMKLEASDELTYCRNIEEDMLQREMDLLKFAVEYDAASRSLLQLAGNFDLFLQEFRWPVMHSLRQATGLIGSLTRIPCFAASCDESPLPTPAP
ncbi:MAG: hypothetical protein PHI23_02075 [Candidatus Peribacteraceae bacterium]|nr:hypothetical protein [Candidatus Peribacteraceae bacterium]